ncbi:MAG: pyrroline-5-carboxylate reductase [Chlamydiae bacterium]|nr:pyrroline-5-carboxylate reductase [Chlamydiota bacterium]
MKIAIIGCGVMGSAFARVLSKNHTLFLSSQNPQKLTSFAQELGASVGDSLSICKQADLIILAVKPKDVKQAAEQISASCLGKLIVSMVAGITTSSLQLLVPSAKVIRIMPNLAISFGKGVVGVVDPSDPILQKMLLGLLESMGLVYFMPETKMDAFTALCGSSPAFILLMIEAMMEGGVALGFTVDDAKQLVVQSFAGAIALMQHTDTHPATLQMQIASPGGTTIAGLNEMELQGVRSGLIQTLFACYDKSVELSKSKESL